MTICKRWMEDANAATKMRPSASEKISSKSGMTARSEGVRPGTVAFVESEVSASTPSCP